MSAWMEYVYMQKPRPMDVTGVEVVLSVLDDNSNFREIGKVTTDSDGFYTLNWKPDIEGPYTLYASFAGSESYWPSHAVSSFAVDPAPQATTTQQPVAAVSTDRNVHSRHRCSHNPSHRHSRRSIIQGYQKTTIDTSTNKTSFPFFCIPVPNPISKF